MNGLIMKDLCNLRGSILFIVVMAAAFAVLFSWETPGGMVLLSAMMMSSLINGSFSFDQNCGWNQHAVSIGITRGSIVRSKFVSGTVFVICGIVLGVFVAAVCGIASGHNVDPYGIASSAVLSLGVGLMASSVICAVNYHVSPQWAHTVSTFCTAVCVAGSIVVCNVMAELFPDISVAMSLIMVMIGAVVYALMYVLSQRRFARTDL